MQVLLRNSKLKSLSVPVTQELEGKGKEGGLLRPLSRRASACVSASLAAEALGKAIFKMKNSSQLRGKTFTPIAAFLFSAAPQGSSTGVVTLKG